MSEQNIILPVNNFPNNLWFANSLLIFLTNSKMNGNNHSLHENLVLEQFVIWFLGELRILFQLIFQVNISSEIILLCHFHL